MKKIKTVMEATMLGAIAALGFSSCHRSKVSLEKDGPKKAHVRMDVPKCIYGGPAMMGGRIDVDIPPVDSAQVQPIKAEREEK